MAKARTPRKAKASAVAVDPSIRVGVGGWTYAPWRGTFFPPGLAHKRELEYASGQLTAIEVNGTFYRAQKPATYASWREQTPEGFVFSLKAPRYSTTRKQLATAGTAIDAFVGDLGALGDRLGPILWQFDPAKAFDADDFAAFLELLPTEVDGLALRHVLEVRHPSFRCREYVELVRRFGRPSVFTDSDEYPSFADLTGNFVYLRLVRANAKRARGYAPAELRRWAARAEAWRAGSAPSDVPLVLPAAADSAPRDVFVYFINGAKVRAPAAAMALLEAIGTPA